MKGRQKFFKFYTSFVLQQVFFCDSLFFNYFKLVTKTQAYCSENCSTNSKYELVSVLGLVKKFF